VTPEFQALETRAVSIEPHSYNRAQHLLAGSDGVAYAAGMAQRFVVVSDNGESWVLGGDPDDGKFTSGKDDQYALPQLLKDGWSSKMVTPGSGTKDDSSYWLVLLEK
jgi:hypothetical protein